MVLLGAPAPNTRRSRVAALLSEAFIDGRAVEPRFVGAAFGPWQVSLDQQLGARANRARLAAAVSELAPEIRTELARVEKGSRNWESGVAAILEGAASNPNEIAERRFEKGVVALEAAAREEPVSALVQSDLAAAYLVRGRYRNDPLDRLAALEAVDRALEIDSSLEEALFNRALVLYELALWHQARETWEKYLERDRRSAWAVEARTRLAVSDERLKGADWQAMLVALDRAVRAGDFGTVRELVARNPQLAREHGETEVLGAWAHAMEEGRVAEASLALQGAQALGEALAELHGDHLLLDSTTAAASPSVAGRVLDSLMAAHRDFAEAARLVENRNYREAEPLLRKVKHVLAETHSSLRRWVTFYLADAEFQRDEYERAYQALQTITSAPDAGRYPSLLARALRVQGLIHRVWGNYFDARRKYERAIVLAEQAGES